jgi:hypothetical protein
MQTGAQSQSPAIAAMILPPAHPCEALPEGDKQDARTGFAGRFGEI